MNEEILQKFTYACATGNINQVKKYLDLGININKHTPNPLKSSLAEEQFELANFLLANGADINKDNNLFNSCLGWEVDRYLWEKEFERSEEKEPGIRYTEYLIKNGININQLDFGKKTPLDRSIEYNHTKAEKLLRSLGAKTSKEIEEENKN